MSTLHKASAVPLQHVAIQDAFWSPYQQRIREIALPYQWEVINDRVPDAAPSGAMRNFRIAAGLETGEFYGYVFQDSDMAKWLEGVSYSLAIHPDPELERLADEVIDIVVNAQQPNGYLNTYFTIKAPGQRWTNLREAHELYTAGHFIEAAVAYYQATGKHKLLEALCRFADHIAATFGPESDKLHGYPGHQEIELALVKLYETTGETRYLQLSKYFLDARGQEAYYFDIEAEKRGDTVIFSEFHHFDRQYAQTHLPVRQQTTAEGHAVRLMYMCAGMADVAAATDDVELFQACQRLWQNITTRRMYLTGAIGSASFGEAFTCDYDLPNDTAYAETCASIGLMMFAHRMLKIEEDRRYGDVLEQALYNTVLSGMSLDGTRYFYVNPLEVWPEACEKNPTKKRVKAVRQKWYDCACCPTNLIRTLTSLGQYIYTTKAETIYTHLYISGVATIEVAGQPVTIAQATRYPWEGAATFTLTLQNSREFGLGFRIPGWCRAAKLRVNGEPVELNDLVQRGYAVLQRTWRDGDQIELELSMPVEVIEANPQVRENAGKIAIIRGPLVYCLEEVDNGQNLSALIVQPDSAMTAAFMPNLLGGAVVITGEAFRVDESGWENRLYQPVKPKTQPVTFTAVPYALWGNRTPGEMTVWIRSA